MKQKELLIMVQMFLRAVCNPVFRRLHTVHNASGTTVVRLNIENCLTVISIVGFLFAILIKCLRNRKWLCDQRALHTISA